VFSVPTTDETNTKVDKNSKVDKKNLNVNGETDPDMLHRPNRVTPLGWIYTANSLRKAKS